MSHHEKIWYRSGPKLRRLKPLRAWEDVGSLSVEPTRLSFRGKRNQITLERPRVISVGPCGMDSVNSWVVIEDMNGARALFADGSRLGWGGSRGGTEALAAEIQAAIDLSGSRVS